MFSLQMQRYYVKLEEEIFLDVSYFEHVYSNIQNSGLLIIFIQKTIIDIILSKPFVVVLHTLICMAGDDKMVYDCQIKHKCSEMYLNVLQ